MTGYKRQGTNEGAFTERCKKLFFLHLCSADFFPNSIVRVGYSKEVYRRGITWFNKNNVPAASRAEEQQEDQRTLSRIHLVTHMF